ncbi:MAG: ferrochelatase [Candidatus Pelagibacter sp. TMED197]|nr:ferrochelatase [Candidatus Pelagibacter sp.]OUW58619.1 MAG: ferrochelatase [Candidatus Pelagibacter sp. TMED197]|tara:strand:- start:640 stop:1632 length:993 start_codon:yes stop_codon:yes gene_type:complete
MNRDHPNIKYGKTGILLVNLGTPDSTSWWDIRKYLKEFLSDRRVIEVNPILWQIILNIFILTFRPSKTAHAYKKIWRKDTNESPLLYFTKMQATKLNNNISNKKVFVDFAMRYGNPSIKSKLYKLKESGCENIVILPLYPQYAAATTATVCDEVYRSLMGMRWQPSLQIIPHYESEPMYIDALINSIENKIKEINWKPDLILSSYHGIPKSYFDKGDPYQCYCQKTTRLMKEKFSKIEIQTTFQSRFGPQEWLTPYTDKTIESLPDKGIKNLLVICPGFVSDCVETLEEINMQGRESFLKKGGKNFDLIPCLNAQPDHIKLFEKLVTKYL